MLRARVRTSGVVAKDFEIKKSKFRMYDVGGQRSERRRWIQYFDHVTAIVFVAAISEYNQVRARVRVRVRVRARVRVRVSVRVRARVRVRVRVGARHPAHRPVG